MKLIIISGNFDPIHVGHLDYIKSAKKLNKNVLCILTRDEQVKLKKGYVFMPFKERAELIDGYGVKVVENIDPDTRCSLTLCALSHMYPNDKLVYLKSGDWTKKRRCPEEMICNTYGIKVVYDNMKKRQSSSSLVGGLKK